MLRVPQVLNFSHPKRQWLIRLPASANMLWFSVRWEWYFIIYWIKIRKRRRKKENVGTMYFCWKFSRNSRPHLEFNEFHIFFRNSCSSYACHQVDNSMSVQWMMNTEKFVISTYLVGTMTKSIFKLICTTTSNITIHF